jgi:hypothetical protein
VATITIWKIKREFIQNVDFGIIACRRSMPQVQRVINHMEDALA